MSLSLVIIVLHYSGLDDTIECLASIGRQTLDRVRTLLIDNGSAEPIGGQISRNFPWVEILRLENNLGWSGGNNTGIRKALAGRADWMCLLNNDTVLPERTMEGLLATAARLGPCLLHPAIDSYGDDPLVQLDPTIPAPNDLQVKPIQNDQYLFEISAVNGACLLVHRSIFDTVGLIDERFFLLCEDADFARRAVKAGYKMFCDTAVRIQHKESRAFGGRRTPVKTYYGFRNFLLFYEKHESWRDAFRVARDLAWMAWGTAQAAGAQPRSWWGLLRFSCSGNSFARAGRMGVRDYALRRFGPINAKDGSKLAKTSDAVAKTIL